VPATSVPDATAPQSNMTSAANPNPIPPGPPDVSTRNPTLDHDLDKLEFIGMWCTPVEDGFSTDATATCYVPEYGMLPDPYPCSVLIKREIVEVVVADNNNDAEDDDDDDETIDPDTSLLADTDDDFSYVSIVCTFYGADPDDTTIEPDYPTTDDDTMTSLDDNSDVDLSFAIFDSYLSFTTLSSDLQPIATTKQLACGSIYQGLSLVPFHLSRRILMGW
jgi:hypothetical protein